MAFLGSQTIKLRRSKPLSWYLREERLEVQLWVTFGKKKSMRPQDSDRLVGSAFLDLSTLARDSKRKQTISGTLLFLIVYFSLNAFGHAAAVFIGHI